MLVTDRLYAGTRGDVNVIKTKLQIQQVCNLLSEREMFKNVSLMMKLLEQMLIFSGLSLQHIWNVDKQGQKPVATHYKLKVTKQGLVTSAVCFSAYPVMVNVLRQ